MTTDDIAKYVVTQDGKPWVPYAELPEKERKKRRVEAEKIAERLRKAMDRDEETRKYYSDILAGNR